MKRMLAALLIWMAAPALAQEAGSTRLPPEFRDSLLQGAHIGICVLDAASGKRVAEYQAEKYFVPASTLKLLTAHLAMQILGDSLRGMRWLENDTAVFLFPTADPTLLHRKFPDQPVLRFLQRQEKPIYLTDEAWREAELGKGWSWDDFSEGYMAERSLLPVYGNTVKWLLHARGAQPAGAIWTAPVYADPDLNWEVRFVLDSMSRRFKVRRERLRNVFLIEGGRPVTQDVLVPFLTHGVETALQILRQQTGKEIRIQRGLREKGLVPDRVIHSQPLDAVLREMLYESDNFLAEQLLLHIAGEKLGYFDVDELIQSTLAEQPALFTRNPEWVDGSGLSRYNLFRPEDLCGLLSRIWEDHGMKRLQGILPPGDSGTLKGYFRGPTPYVYAKTGTLSGIVCLSGYLKARSGRILIFTVMVNHHTARATPVRRRIERYLNSLRDRF